MNAVLKKILETGTAVSPDGKVFKIQPHHIPQKECEIIQAWIEIHRPKRLLEVGLAYGISAMFICDTLTAIGLPTNYHLIDPFQRSVFKSTGLLNLDRAGYRNIYTFHEEFSEVCLPQLLTQGVKFDFALIDGNHTFDHSLVDFFYVNRMLEVGGIVIFDDIQLPAIQKIMAHITTYDCYTLLQVPSLFFKSKQAIVRKMLQVKPFRVAGFLKTSMDKRKWNWHVDF